MSNNLLIAIKEAAEDAGMPLTSMARLLSYFLRKAADESGFYEKVILLGLSEEIRELTC